MSTINGKVCVANGRNLLLNSDQQFTNSVGQEFVTTTFNLNDIFDKYGTDQVYTISYDLSSNDPSKVSSIRAYTNPGSTPQNKYWFPDVTHQGVTTTPKRFSMTFKPKLVDETITKTTLVFYGEYDSGNIPIVNRIKVEFGNVATPYSQVPVDKVFSDGKQVYGRNYFLNSDFSQAKTNWNDNNGVWFVSGEKYNGQKVMTATPTVAWVIGAQNSFSQTRSTITNQQVTVSLWAKASKSGAKFHSEPYGGNGAFNVSLTTTWKRYSYVTQITTVGAIHFMAVDVGTHYWISMPQVEIGNKVTDWSLAPEDVM